MKENTADNAAAVVGYADLAASEIVLMKKAILGGNLEMAGFALTRAMRHVQRVNTLFGKLPESGDLFGRVLVLEDAGADHADKD